MATLYEYYNTGDDNRLGAWAQAWNAQTFTPSQAHKITSVKLLLFRKGLPGIVTASIRATDGSGLPNGADLCSGTIDGDTLTTDEAGAWYEITLGDGYNLDADTKYAIVIRAPTGTVTKTVEWRADISSPTYPGGCYNGSNNSGVDWFANSNYDFMFEEWGEPIPVVAPTVTTQAASSVEATTATGNGNITDNGGENPDDRRIEWGTSTGNYPNSCSAGAGGGGSF
ncbi:unnamed protein product [marine sediment metagenome]|uniref:Uncharacterized protein n=1 Tax=marine sediment metagenome TaxID=412755 RepID=X1TTR5_9ZZZZ